MADAVVTDPSPRAPEVQVAADLARRALPIAPALIVAGAIGWGAEGALSAAVAIVIVLVNFLAAAGLIAWGAGRSAAALMGAVLGGYVLRLAVVLAALFAIQDASWIERAPLFATLLITHVGLLIWETRYVSVSLAYPGLKPKTVQKETRSS
jgi:hypothetical protein